MKWLMLCLGCLAGAELSAREPLRVPPNDELALATEPTPLDPVADQAGTPVAYSEYVVERPVQYIQLYSNVRVRDRKNMHPNAVTKIVSIPDPCDKCRRVNVEICVPPCAAESVRCFKSGDRIRFCYGRYSVDVVSRRRDVVVNYND